MINLALSKEIYAANPWCVDQVSFPALISILDNISNGVSLEIPEQKYNSCSVLDLKSGETRLINDTYQLRNDADFQGIGIINIDGVITVSGGMSSYGMDYLSSQMNAMARDSRIKAFIVRGNSGGGSSMAVEIMTDTILSVKKKKKVYGSIKKGGMMASACFGIMSACDSIHAESEMSTVGSAGTMMQFSGRKANTEQDGVKYIRLYAPESQAKNKGYEEAVNNDNYKVLTDEVLKPFNQRFLSLIESNRPQMINSGFRDGHTVFAKNGIGTFIDGIKSFAEVVEMASSGEEIKSKTEPKKQEDKKESSTININNKNKKMTKAEIKAAHPDAYNEIVAEGVALEKDRAGAWLAHNATDPDAVKKGIESGEGISATQREEFFVKQNSSKQLGEMKSESAEEVVTTESTTDAEKTAEQKELDEAFNFELD